MTLKQEQLARVFEVNGVRFPDLDPSLTPMEVRDLIAAAGRPELSSAEVRGPEIRGNELVFTLHRAVGTKALAPASDTSVQAREAAVRQALRVIRKRTFQPNIREAQLAACLTQAEVGAAGNHRLQTPGVLVPWVF